MNKETQKVVFSSGTDDRGTPDSVFKPLDREFHFEMDAAADQTNHKVAFWLGPGGVEEDGLAAHWPDYGGPMWCNPPYSRGLQGQFIAKAAVSRVHGILTVMLIPSRTDTVAFHSYIWDRRLHRPQEGVEVRFLKGRIKFEGAKHGAPFPSMVVVFRP